MNWRKSEQFFCILSLLLLIRVAGFFFATSVVTDGITHEPAQFISGYAVQHRSKQIVY